MTRALLLTTLLAGLSGCPQTIERACGRDGEGCCEGTCGEGLACVQDRCAPCPAGGCGGCGVEGAACCAAGPACGDGLRCDANLCIARCGDGCEPRTRGCSAEGLPQACFVDQGAARCTSWDPLDACGDGEVCRDGKCTDACETGCRPDELACGPAGPLTCRVDPVTACPDWTPIELADGGDACVNGACVDLFCWENPLPAGGALRSFQVDELGDSIAIDSHGNTLISLVDSWQYDYRARDAQSAPMIQVAPCFTVSTSMGITGQELYVRAGGGWRLQPLPRVGLPLTAIACGLNPRWAVAGGEDATIQLTDSDEVYAFDVPGVGAITRLLLDPLGDALYAFGPDMPGVVRCAISRGPLRTSCRLEEPTRPFLSSFEVAAIRKDGVVYTANTRGDVFRREDGVWRADGSIDGSPSALAIADDGSAWIGTLEGGLFARTPLGNWNARSAFTTAPIRGIGIGELEAVVADQAFRVFAVTRDERDRPAVLTTREVTDATLEDVDGDDARDLYAVGEGGTILHRKGELWQREAVGLTNVALHALAWVSPNEVYAFGDGGMIFARRDGVWRREASTLTSYRLTAAFTDGERVWAGGSGGLLIERPVGPDPELWEFARPYDARAETISSITGHASSGVGGADEVIATDYTCELTRRTPQGVFRDPIPGCDDPPVLATFDDRGDLWLAGGIAPMTIYRRTGGLFTAERLPLDAPEALFASGPDVWLVGLGGDLYVHQAEQWRPQSTGLPVPSGAGTATRAGDIFLVGSGGTIWHRR